MKDIAKMFNLVTIGSMILDIVLILMGIFLIANPSIGTSSALMLFGIILLVSGVYSIIKYIINPKGIFKLELVYGILSIITGALSIFKPFDVISFITIIVGIWLIINAVTKLVIALEIRKVSDAWIFDLTISILTIILGILLLANPFYNYVVLSVYAGVMMVVYAAMDLLEQLFIRNRAKFILKMFK